MSKRFLGAPSYIRWLYIDGAVITSGLCTSYLLVFISIMKSMFNM